MEPTIKRATTPKALDREIYLHKNLLGYVVSIVAISEDAVRNPADLGLISFDEVAECCLVAGLSSPNEVAFRIRFLCGRFTYMYARCIKASGLIRCKHFDISIQ